MSRACVRTLAGCMNLLNKTYGCLINMYNDVRKISALFFEVDKRLFFFAKKEVKYSKNKVSTPPARLGFLQD